MADPWSWGRARAVGCSAALLWLAPLHAVGAQLCAGSMTFLVRDATGEPLDERQMTELTVVSVNGIPLRLVERAASPDTASFMRRRAFPAPGLPPDDRVVDRRNPLAFDMSSELAFCGRLNDMVLRFRGMEMRLFLDIREYRHYAIDSPPFQQGTFHLRTTVCDEGARAHRPDSRDPPRCRLAGNAWVGPDSAWVRHPTPVFLSGGPLPRPIAPCGREEVRVITSRADWAELWRAHPEALRSNRLVEFDFRYQALLAIYSQLRHPGLTSESLRVDPRGDLTVHLAPGAVDPAHCSVTFVVINRSGVRSVNGNPIGEGQR